jgi:hypothetical protein
MKQNKKKQPTVNPLKNVGNGDLGEWYIYVVELLVLLFLLCVVTDHFC